MLAMTRIWELQHKFTQIKYKKKKSSILIEWTHWKEIYKIAPKIEGKLECKRVEFKLKYLESKSGEKDKDSSWLNSKKKANECYSLYYKYKFEGAS